MPKDENTATNPKHFRLEGVSEPIETIEAITKNYPPGIGYNVGSAVAHIVKAPLKKWNQAIDDLKQAEDFLRRARIQMEEYYAE